MRRSRRSTVEQGVGEAGDAYERAAERNAERYVRGGQHVRPAGRRIARRGCATTVGHGPLQLYSGAKAASYAQRSGPCRRTRPFRGTKHDCTNFVSQAVLEGIWTMTSGGCGSRKDNDVWWYRAHRCWYPKVRSTTLGRAADVTRRRARVLTECRLVARDAGF